VKLRKRKKKTEDQRAGSDDPTPEDVINLTGHNPLSDAADEMHEELVRIARKIDALQERRRHLLTELGLDVTVDSQSTENLSEAFLDENASPFERFADDSFDIDDKEFDELFAVFAASDGQGDHRARKWFDSQS